MSDCFYLSITNQGLSINTIIRLVVNQGTYMEIKLNRNELQLRSDDVSEYFNGRLDTFASMWPARRISFLLRLRKSPPSKCRLFLKNCFVP